MHPITLIWSSLIPWVGFIYVVICIMGILCNEEYIKIHKNAGYAGGGILLKDSSGHVLFESYFLRVGTCLFTEIHILHKGLVLCKQRDFN